MSSDRVFDVVQIVTVAGSLGLGVVRAALMYARGVRVVSVDRRRTLAQLATDDVMILSLLVFCYLALAYSWPLPRDYAPAWASDVWCRSPVIKAVGALLLCGGSALYAAALGAMGRSWRIGIDRLAPGSLVTTGVFAVSRNPIYLAFDVMMIGTFLVQGRPIFLLLAIIIVVAIHATILREERFLSEAYGDDYREYRRRVGRYVTWPK